MLGVSEGEHGTEEEYGSGRGGGGERQSGLKLSK